MLCLAPSQTQQRARLHCGSSGVSDSRRWLICCGPPPGLGRYRRDSLAHFLLYWLRFALGAWLEVRACWLSAQPPWPGIAVVAAGGCVLSPGLLVKLRVAQLLTNCATAFCQVPLRCVRYRRWGLLAASCAAEAAYFAAGAAAWRVNPRAALWVLLIPYCISSLALMFGK